jgi:hypothetical protein
VLGRDHGTLHDEDVEPGLYGGPVVLLYPLGRQGGGGYNATRLYLLHPAEDELLFYGLLVELLQDARGLVLGQARYLLEDRLRVLVAGLQALQVQHREPAELSDDDRRAGVYGGVQGARQTREVQVQVPEAPGDVYVLRVPGPPARHYGDLVEPVGPPRRLSLPDLNVHKA